MWLRHRLGRAFPAPAHHARLSHPAATVHAASRQMDQVKNARLDLDNQKRKLANSTEAERKAHYEAKVRPVMWKGCPE